MPRPTTDKRMTKAEALRIILEFAGRHIGGTGQGIGAPRYEGDRERARKAARILWPDAYGFKPYDNDLRNMGF